MLRDPGLDDGLGGNLDRLAGRGVATHPRLPFLHDELYHSREHELARALQLFLGEAIKIPAKTVVKARIAKQLKDSVLPRK